MNKHLGNFLAHLSLTFLFYIVDVVLLAHLSKVLMSFSHHAALSSIHHISIISPENMWQNKTKFV
jgi:hypothetical protein